MADVAQVFAVVFLASEQEHAARPQAELHGELDRQADVVERNRLERRHERREIVLAAVFRGQGERADAFVGEFAAPAEGVLALGGDVSVARLRVTKRRAGKDFRALGGGRRPVRRRGTGPSRRGRRRQGNDRGMWSCREPRAKGAGPQPADAGMVLSRQVAGHQINAFARGLAEEGIAALGCRRGGRIILRASEIRPELGDRAAIAHDLHVEAAE